MRPAWLSVKVECIDCPFAGLHLKLFLGYPLSVQSHVLIDASDLSIFLVLLVNFAAVSLKDPHFSNHIILKVCLFLQTRQKVRKGAVPRH